MKGLFVKDFKLLTSGGNYFIVVFVLTAFGAFCMAADGEYPGDVGFESVLIAAAAVEAKVYDFYDNGMAYLLTLPISRRRYVRESYLFAILEAVVLMLVFSFMSIAVMALMGSDAQSYLTFLCDVRKSFGIILLLIAVLIPFYILFGVKKSNYIAAVIVLLIAGGVMFVLLMALDAGVVLAVMLQQGLKILAKFPVALLVLAGSYVLSVIAMERKDF